MRSPAQKASEFIKIDVHDDTIEHIAIIPATKLRGHDTCRVELILFRHWEKTRRLLQFTDCINIIAKVDCTILKGNTPNNTAGLLATAEVGTIIKMVKSLKREWNVTYEKSIDPLPSKLNSALKYTLFRVELFGGNIDIAAKNYKIKRITK